MELKKAIRRNKGSATIETAAMFLLLIVLVVGFMHLIHAITTYSVIQTAAREGAREYSLTDSKTKAVSKAVQELKMGGIDPGKAKITTYSIGQERRVTVTLNYDFYVPFLGKNGITLESGAVFRVVEHPE